MTSVTPSSPELNQLIDCLGSCCLSPYYSTDVQPRIALLVEEFDLLYGVGLIFGQGCKSNSAPRLDAPNKPFKVDQEGSTPLGYQLEHPVFKTVKTLGGSPQASSTLNLF